MAFSMHTEYYFPNVWVHIYLWAISFTHWPAKQFSKLSPLGKRLNVWELCSKGVAKSDSSTIALSEWPTNGTVSQFLMCDVLEQWFIGCIASVRYCCRGCQNTISTVGSVSQWPLNQGLHGFNIKIWLSAMLTCFFLLSQTTASMVLETWKC